MISRRGFLAFLGLAPLLPSAVKALAASPPIAPMVVAGPAIPFRYMGGKIIYNVSAADLNRNFDAVAEALARPGAE